MGLRAGRDMSVAMFGLKSVCLLILQLFASSPSTAEVRNPWSYTSIFPQLFVALYLSTGTTYTDNQHSCNQTRFEQIWRLQVSVIFFFLLDVIMSLS
jgi:hypothetical protein